MAACRRAAWAEWTCKNKAADRDPPDPQAHLEPRLVRGFFCFGVRRAQRGHDAKGDSARSSAHPPHSFGDHFDFDVVVEPGEAPSNSVGNVLRAAISARNSRHTAASSAGSPRHISARRPSRSGSGQSNTASKRSRVWRCSEAFIVLVCRQSARARRKAQEAPVGWGRAASRNRCTRLCARLPLRGIEA